jgi:adenylate cyclase
MTMAHILVVDDYPVTRRVLRTQLAAKGHAVVTAASAFEALSELAAGVFDIAIVDIAMPEMDGISLLEKVRGNNLTERLPVIMLTASGDDEDRARAREAGANMFLTKPASSWELLKAVERCLAENLV